MRTDQEPTRDLLALAAGAAALVAGIRRPAPGHRARIEGIQRNQLRVFPPEPAR